MPLLNRIQYKKEPSKNYQAQLDHKISRELHIHNAAPKDGSLASEHCQYSQVENKKVTT